MDSDTLRQQIKMMDPIQEIKHLKVTTSSLGGHSSVCVWLSLDAKEDWINNIFHNSRYAIFHISDGKVELISKGMNMPKFRKSKGDCENKVSQKIIKYCMSV